MTGAPRPAGYRPPRTVAVVGAGLAGLAAATALARGGCAVRVLERGRGVGGRTAHRRAGGRPFDHGAQYFTARDPGFARQVRSWSAAGVVARWNGRIVALRAGSSAGAGVEPVAPQPRFVGVPGMNAMAKALAQELPVTTGCAVTAASRDGGSWSLATSAGVLQDPFDALVLAMPAEQAGRLLGPGGAAAIPGDARSLPCWCVLAAFDAPLAVDFDGAFVSGSALDWIARDSSKPGRPAGERWVLHATPGWSAERLSHAPGVIAQALLGAFFDALAIVPRAPAYCAGHRWSFARPGVDRQIGCHWQRDLALALCGDWCRGGRVEGAYLSGLAAAGCLLGGSADHHGMG